MALYQADFNRCLRKDIVFYEIVTEKQLDEAFVCWCAFDYHL